MAKLEIYKDIERVPDSTEYAIAPGRQLGIGFSLEDALAQPYGLSLMSRLNVVAGVMVAEATDSELVVTGNHRKNYPQGATKLLDESYRDVVFQVESESPTTLASARNVAPILKTIIEKSGLIDIVITSDKLQGIKLARFFKDQGIAIRGVAVAHRMVLGSTSPEDRALAEAYKKDWPKRIPENFKQALAGLLDPHGTRTEGSVQKARA